MRAAVVVLIASREQPDKGAMIRITSVLKATSGPISCSLRPRNLVVITVHVGVFFPTPVCGGAWCPALCLSPSPLSLPTVSLSFVTANGLAKLPSDASLRADGRLGVDPVRTEPLPRRRIVSRRWLGERVCLAIVRGRRPSHPTAERVHAGY